MREDFSLIPAGGGETMRTIIFFMTICWAGFCFAGGLDKVILPLSSISTSATASEVNSGRIDGRYERIDIYFSATTNSLDLDIISSNKLSNVQTTLYSVDAKTNTASVSIMPRASIHNSAGVVLSTNSAERFVALDEVLYFKAANSLYTGKSATAIVIYER